MKFPLPYKEQQKLSNYTTLGIGGEARYFIEVREISDMQRIIRFCKDHSLSYIILGKGSNCLFDDRGFHGAVIANRIDFFERPTEGVFHVGAGYSFSLLGAQTARQGWAGLEFASGIPGSVGGAVYMNAGANGLETCQSLVSVDFIDSEGNFIEIPRTEIEFRYRYSSFHHKPGAIVGATFKLTPSQEAREKQLTIIQYRTKTQPYGTKSAGCIFRNPSCGSAGAMIDQMGLKGTTIGGAQVSPMHANFIVNANGATAQDVLQLIALIQREIKEKKGIELEPEVCYIPYDWSFPKDSHE